MKNQLLVLLVSLFFYNSYAQKPVKGFFGIGLDYKLQREVHVVSNYSVWGGGSGNDYRIESYNYFPALKFDYFFANTFSINLFFRPSFVNKTETNERFEDNKNFSSTNIQRYSMDIGIGLEKHFFRNLKIDPFVGVNFHYLYSDRGRVGTLYKNYYHNNFDYRETSTIVKGVASHGFYSTINFGLNYFISQNFSLGGNLDFGYRYSIEEGTSSYHSDWKDYSYDGDVVDEKQVNTSQKIKKENTGFIYSFSVKAAFYFGLIKVKKAE